MTIPAKDYQNNQFSPYVFTFIQILSLGYLKYSFFLEPFQKYIIFLWLKLVDTCLQLDYSVIIVGQRNLLAGDGLSPKTLELGGHIEYRGISKM